MPKDSNPGARAGACAADPDAPATTGADGEEQFDDPLGLVNFEPFEYEPMRRWLARQYGWRVAALDRYYREVRRKAGRAWR
jgi:hypothetical protein